MFDLVKKYDKDVERLYTYNWFGAGDKGCEGFDAGLVEENGDQRPAYAAFKSGLKSYSK